jgi:hypothetical protein
MDIQRDPESDALMQRFGPSRMPCLLTPEVICVPHINAPARATQIVFLRSDDFAELLESGSLERANVA